MVNTRFGIALKSKKHNNIELDIMGSDESYELIHHSYYKNGKLLIDMCI